KPPTDVRPSGAYAMKFATANRRATSSTYGFSPRFSWITITAGTFALAFAGRANSPLMLPLPCGDGTVSTDVLMRASSFGTCGAPGTSDGDACVAPERLEPLEAAGIGVQLLRARATAERRQRGVARGVWAEAARKVLAGRALEMMADLVVEIRVHARPTEQRD